MQYARYEIGTKHDEDGAPLFLADGKVVGTVEQVKAMVARFELAVDDGAGDGRDGEGSELISSAVVDFVRNEIRRYDRVRREAYLRGAAQ